MSLERRSWLTRALLAVGVAILVWQPLAALVEIPVRNWAVPRPNGIASPLGDISGGLPFVAVTPCRVLDTRNANGPYGGPKMAASETRSFSVPGGPCSGIPNNAAAFSLNITVTQTDGPGYIAAYPAGAAVPNVSTLNYVANQSVANAAIVPSGTEGFISVLAAGHGTHLLIDINGYFSSTLNATKQLSVVGSVSGSGLIAALNTSPTSGSAGVTGMASGGMSVVGVQGTLVSPGGVNGAGVRGVVPDGTDSYAVVGQVSGTLGYPGGGSWGLVGSGKKGGAYGSVLLGNSTTGARGVWGNLPLSYGTIPGAGNFGVFGTIESGMSGSGVVGQAGPVTLGYPQGWGVIGGGVVGGVMGVLSSSASISGSAVQGGFYTGGGVSLSPFGALGYKASPTSTVYAVWAQGNIGGSGAKFFVEPHPADPDKVIRYVALEGPEAGTYFRGTGRTRGGEAVIEVPDTFAMVTADDGITVQLTPVGELATMAVISEDLRQIVVRSSKDVAFHYQVNGVRRAFRDLQVVVEGGEFRPTSRNAKLPEGLPEETRQRLITNGTYNADGTVNMRTAERLGWTQEWDARERAALAGAPTPK